MIEHEMKNPPFFLLEIHGGFFIVIKINAIFTLLKM